MIYQTVSSSHIKMTKFSAFALNSLLKENIVICTTYLLAKTRLLLYKKIFSSRSQMSEWKCEFRFIDLHIFSRFLCDQVGYRFHLYFLTIHGLHLKLIFRFAVSLRKQSKFKLIKKTKKQCPEWLAYKSIGPCFRCFPE